MGSQKTHDEFILKMAELNPNISILGEYKKAIIPVEVSCKICGYTWNARPANLQGYTGCPVCGGSLKKTHETFINEISIINPNIEIIGEYTHSHCDIEVRCKIHDYKYISQPTTLLSGVGCIWCGSERTSLAKMNNGYNLLIKRFQNTLLTLITSYEEYISYDRKNLILKYLCPIHGEIYNDKIDNFVARGCKCLECIHDEASKKHNISLKKPYRTRKTSAPDYVHPLRMSHDQFMEKLNYINTDIKVLETYTKSDIKITVKCLICGHIYKVMPSKLLAGRRCPSCAASRNESACASHLKEYCKEKYPDTKWEYKIIKNPLTGYWLSYDIYIPKFKLFCEVMGSQHYDYAADWHSSYDTFLKTQERDQIKKNYAIQNGYYLDIDLRVYKDFKSAKALLNKKLKQINNLI